MSCRGVKFHMNCDPAFDLELIERVATVYRDSGIRFMVDLEQEYSFDDAVRLGRRLAALDFDWMEAPLPDTDLDAYAALTASVAIDVLPVGYVMSALDVWADALRRGAWSRLRCEVCSTGGITTAVQALALGRAFGVPTELQSFGYPATQAANLQVMLGVPGCTWFEYPMPGDDFSYAAIEPLRLDAEGCIGASHDAGLGLTLDWATIEADAVTVFDSAT